MKNSVLCALFLAFLSCANKQEIKGYSKSTIGLGKSDEKISSVKSDTIYNGNWFSISYPKMFKAQPIEPVIFINNYIYVETDEASFSSENEEVEFFVYSPQWGGNPHAYLKATNREEIISKEEESNQGDFDEENASEYTTSYITFKEVSGKYTRSVVSIKTATTHLVFGIKYKNLKSYNKYKEDYLKFKTSLIQYAD